MLPGNDVTVTTRHSHVQKARRHKPTRCSICTGAIWLHPIALQEPAGVPEPRRIWVLCRSCHEALLLRMRLSPVHSPLRLRIALGLVAAERSPHAYGVGSHTRDQRRFIAIAWVLLIAMVLHLAVIVFLSTLR